MNQHRSLAGLILLFLFSISSLAACAPASQEDTQAGPATLKIAILPILDALPIYVAQEQDYFQGEGVIVEFIPVGSAAERDQVMTARQADGMINDLVSTVLYNKDNIQIQIVSFARTATAEFPQYRLLASGESGITTVEDMKGVEIGISEASVIEYTTDRLLEAQGFSADEIKKIAVPRIDLRMSMLGSGELKAANLPDPAASLAIQGGAVLILDDTSHPEYGNSVISFRKAVIDENPDAIRGFLAALEKAAAEINSEPTQWEDLLTEQNLVPAPLIGTYQIPPFPTGNLPTEAQWIDVLAWAKGKDLIGEELNIPYQESVTDEFLP